MKAYWNCTKEQLEEMFGFREKGLTSCFLCYRVSTMRNKECALAHSRACGGRLRHLPYTPQCVSSRSVFYFTGKQFPVKQKRNEHFYRIKIIR